MGALELFTIVFFALLAEDLFWMFSSGIYIGYMEDKKGHDADDRPV